jgi:hypothetical protein
MTNEERFQRIESDLAAAAHNLKETAEALGVLSRPSADTLMSRTSA